MKTTKIEEYCLYMHVICQQHLIHSLFYLYFYHAYSFYLSTTKLPETLSQMPIVLEESDVRGWRTQSKPLFSRRKCLNEVTNRSSQEPQAFLNRAAERTITIFGQSTRGRWEMANWMNKGYFSFLNAPAQLRRMEALLPFFMSFSEELIITLGPALFHLFHEHTSSSCKKAKTLQTETQVVESADFF